MGAPQLAVVESRELDSWWVALEGALRAEFLVSPLVLPPGSPLAPPECGVPGCPRAGERAPWGRFETRLCHAHWAQWSKDDRPGCTEEWLSAQPPPTILQPLERCAADDCRRSVSSAGLCDPHRHDWAAAGRPPLERFARSARPAAVGDALCIVPGCGFPACSARSGTPCDTHLARFHAWRHRRLRLAEPDRSVKRYIEELGVRGTYATLACLPLPDAPLIALELRFALQCRHDEGDGFINAFRWRETVKRLNESGAGSLLDCDWQAGQGTSEGRRVPTWMFYVNYAHKMLLAFRARCGLDDPWAPDVWHIQALPIDHDTGRLRNLDWRPIRPAWLRELSKRWARHRLRGGTSFSHVNSIRLAGVRLVEFCELADWPLEDPSCLTRELFDAFLDHVRFREAGVEHRRKTAYGVKQLFEDSHDLGWISLRHPRVYLGGELPVQKERLPRALPPELVVRLNQPRSLERLTVSERAAVLVVLDCGLRATDSARLKIDAVGSGSDGAPYLRYFNHKRRREAVVPLSDRAAEAIAAQRASVQGRYPGCEWLFPRLYANGRGKQPMGYSFIYRTLHRWMEALELRDEHGEPSRPSPHAFRHTYATGLINNDVDLFSVQSLLDHDSPEMTWRYARLSNDTLRRKWEQGQRRINIRGEIVPLDVDGELSDAAWAKEQIARAKQSLPNGWCGLPLQQSCPHPNACLTCPAFLTDQTFLPQHREQLARTEQLIELGKHNGNERLVEINEATRINLVAIIERAEQLEREQHDSPEREEHKDAAA
jgi:integrase